MIYLLLLLTFFVFGCPDAPVTTITYKIPLLSRTSATLKAETKRECGNTSSASISYADEAILGSFKALTGDKMKCFNLLANDLQENLASLAEQVKIKHVPQEEVLTNAYDIAVIGAGGASSVFTRNFLEVNPSAKVILLDKEPNTISAHFRTYLYRINSPEAFPSPPPPTSTNIFPGSPIQISDFDLNQRFVPARALWNEIILTQFFTKADVLMAQDIKHIKKLNLAGQKIYQISLDNLTNIFAKKIVIAPGLGLPNIPMNKDSTEVFDQEKQACAVLKCLPRVMSIDDLIYFHDLYAKKGWDIFEELGKKKLAVVGAQDAGMVVMEFLGEQAPKEAYLNYEAPAEITWFNQKLESYDAFQKDPNIKPRYKVFPLVQKFYTDLFDKKSYTTKNGTIAFNLSLNRLVKISLSHGDAEVLMDTDNEKDVSFDYIILSTGYINNVKTILQDLMSDEDKHVKALLDLCPRATVNNKTAALKCKLSGEEQDVYIIGTAATGLATQDDINASFTKNMASFNVLNPISATFAREYLKL